MKVDRVIYQFWTGDNEITENRRKGLESLARNAGVERRLVTAKELPEYVERSGVPLHKAYQYLSAVHRSDYLRCYFLHLFGGGYADIKVYSVTNNWAESFNEIERNDWLDVIGQKEIQGGSPIAEFNNSENLKRLVANCYFIVRPKSVFSTLWWELVNRRLDEKYEALKANPATCPRDGYSAGKYPLRWAEIMGEQFHRVCHALWPVGKVSDMLVSGREWGDYQ